MKYPMLKKRDRLSTEPKSYLLQGPRECIGYEFAMDLRQDIFRNFRKAHGDRVNNREARIRGLEPFCSAGRLMQL